MTLLAVGTASAVSFSLLAPVAGADELTSQRDQLKTRIAQTKDALDESSKALQAAAVAVDKAAAKLSAARAQLAWTRKQLAVARARDAAMAAKLKQAQADLAAAKAAVLAGQARLDAQKELAGAMVRDQYQQQENLLPIAALVGASSPQDLQTRLQWSTTMFDTAAAEIDELSALQLQLNAARARQAELEAQVAADRKAAADNLKLKKRLEVRAQAEQATVTRLLHKRQAIEAAAARDVAQDKARYAKLQRERSSVEHRIAARIAAQRAAARREAARRAAAARRHHKPVPRSNPGSGHSSSGLSNAPHGFMFPVAGPITSPYGMRFHPVLHYWKLHDGTDFGASCGTPIRAAYGGKVVERYYNAGYGNRLMIDHGSVDGRYVTTGYNHAIRYVVSVGQHVRQGQVIGYVGETGYATGCHLHLMVWLDGRMVNPMTWF